MNDKTTSGSHSKVTVILGIPLLAIILLILFVVPLFYDPPRAYMISDPTSTADIQLFCQFLKEDIAAHLVEIAQYGELASALDADRYWPLDMSLTVLAMQQYRLELGHPPDSLDELQNSDAAFNVLLSIMPNDTVDAYWQSLRTADIVSTGSFIHNNWQLVKTNHGWEIQIDGFGAIAYGN